MKTLNRLVTVAGVVLATFFGAAHLAAQNQQQPRPGRGNLDPAQFRQNMLDDARGRLEVKSDDEWKVIQPLIEKVVDARREVGFGGGFVRGPRRGGGNNNNDAQSSGNNQGGGRGFRGGGPGPEAEDLQKAIDANASKDELKAKLAKFREARKEKEAKLASAQEELKKVLSVKQEAAAVLIGLLQ